MRVRRKGKEKGGKVRMAGIRGNERREREEGQGGERRKGKGESGKRQR